MTTIIDGKKLAQETRDEIKEEVILLKKKNITPGIAVVLVGDNPASKIYIKNKRKACTEAGMENFEHTLPSDTSQKDLLNLISSLNTDKKVHGILVQLPLPSHIDEQVVIESINPAKDVDGFHPANVGKLFAGLPCFRPCTPTAVIALIDHSGTDLTGKHAVVVGRSNIVGKPAAIMLLERDATVTICHSRTKNLDKFIGEADVLVAAVGKSRMIRGEWIKKGAVVIDVGINRDADGKLTGDVEFESACLRASAITPVPGGVGPMTIAMLLKNTLEATKQQAG